MLEEKALQAVEKHRMLARGDRVVVGVSGGPDSVVLLHWLSRLAKDRGFQVHAAHLDHMLRGHESADDARWVQRFVDSLGLTATVEAADVAALKRDLGTSLEDAGRQARYSFFARVVRDVGGACVAVAHTFDDQVETILLNWLRGAGLAGLRGMQSTTTNRVEIDLESAPRGLKVVRPLLEISRAEVESYLLKHGLVARVDRSNEDPVFLRNRVRRELIPYLQGYNPRVKESILRAARGLGADYDYIRTNVEEVWASVAMEEGRRIRFNLAAWRELPESIQRHLLREAVSRLVGDVVGLGTVHIDAALAAVESGRTGVTVTWPRGLVVAKTYDHFSVGLREERALPTLSLEGQRIEVPGRTRLLGTPWAVEASEHSDRCEVGGGAFSAELDASHVGHDLVVRRRRPGDKFRPLGMRGEKSLQDFFVDSKVPEGERDNVPILSSPEVVVWVVGYRIDDRVKVTESTKKRLCLRFIRSPGEGGCDAGDQRH